MSIIDPDGATILSRTVTTDYKGEASVNVRISDKFIIGSYQVVTSATVNGETLKDTAAFAVKSQTGSSNSNISIQAVQATDQQGSAVSSFKRGAIG